MIKTSTIDYNQSLSDENIDPHLIKTASEVNLFLKRAFTDVVCSGPQLDAQKMRSLSVMPVCTHRSQADYFILGTKLHDLGFRRVKYAAGDNLTEFPILGNKFKALGAFPVSRSKASKRSYVRELCERVTTMMISGENVVVFPEGGRSYKGDMMEIKSGLIASNLVAQWRNPEMNFHFFPVALSYEKLPELAYFDMLKKGKTIRSASQSLLNQLRGNFYYFGADIIAFSKFMQAGRLFKPYKSVFLDYDNPIPVKELVDLKSLFSKGRDDFSSLRSASQAVSDQIRNKFLALYRIHPSHIVAFIIKSKSCYSISEIVSMVPDVINLLEKQGRNTKSIDALQPAQIVDTGIMQLSDFKGIKIRNGNLIIRNYSAINYHAETITLK